MFESIAIKKNEFGGKKIDAGFLIESLLFYEKVIVIADEFVLKDLFGICGFEPIKELIISDKLELKIRENYLGSMQFPFGESFKYNIDIVTAENTKARNLLFKSIQSITRNSTKSIKLTDEFIKLSSPYNYPKGLTDSIRDDFSNESLMQNIFAISLNNIVSNLSLNPKEIECKIEKDTSFGPFDTYGIETNINFNEITTKYQSQVGKDFTINPSGILLDLAEFRGDLSISTELGTALVTDSIQSIWVESTVKNIFEKLKTEQTGLDNFQQIVLNDFIDIGETIRSGKRNFSDFLPIIQKADKFKGWLSKIDDDKDIISEYYKAIKDGTWLDKHVPKILRFSLFTGAGIGFDLLLTGGLGTVAGVTLGAIDTFLLNNLIKGWKPNQFIDKNLRSNLILKK